MLGPATTLRRSVEMTIWQLVRLAIFDNELWTDYATLVCSHACDILSLNSVIDIEHALAPMTLYNLVCPGKKMHMRPYVPVNLANLQL